MRPPFWRRPARFNEAPAERGGKRSKPLSAPLPQERASMRPPLNAGENKEKAMATRLTDQELQ